MIPIDKVRDIISKHKLLEKELSSNEIDKKNFAKKFFTVILLLCQQTTEHSNITNV